MKRFLLVMVFSVAVAVQSTYALISVGWGSGDASYLYNSSGGWLNPMVSGDSYMVQLVIDVGNDTTMANLTSGYIGLTGDANWSTAIDLSAAEDQIWSADMRLWSDVSDPGAPEYDGMAYVDYLLTSVTGNDAWAGSAFYFRWFNSDSQATATEAGFIYGAGGVGGISGWTLPAATTPPAPAIVANADIDYGAGALGSTYTAGANDGWATVAPVPEPGTIALFALGVATLAASRRRRKAIQA